jgi:hypothetical protein
MVSLKNVSMHHGIMSSNIIYSVSNLTEAQKVALDFVPNLRNVFRHYGFLESPDISVEVYHGLISQAINAERYLKKAHTAGIMDTGLFTEYMAQICQGYELLGELVDNRLLNFAKE